MPQFVLYPPGPTTRCVNDRLQWHKAHADQMLDAPGGSENTKNEVRKIVSNVLQAAKDKGIEVVREGDLAKYVLDFDRQKRKQTFNYARYVYEKKKLSLHIDDGCQLRINLTPEQLDKVFGKAYSRG